MGIIFGLALFVVFAYLTRVKYPKIKRLYSQDHGLWYGVKYVIGLILLGLRVFRLRVDRKINTENGEQGDWESPDDFVENDDYAMNTWALIGGDKHGNILLVRMCRRLEGRIEIWLILRLADGRTFTHPAHPDTVVQDETPFGEEFEDAILGGAGMRFQAKDPAKVFRFSYAGLLRLHSPDDATLPTDGYNMKTRQPDPTPEYIEVDLRVWYRALSDPAELLIDAHPAALARAFANEDWGNLNLKTASSSSKNPHAQQSGEMRGFVKILGEHSDFIHIGEEPKTEIVELSLWGMRNRTRGRRDWAEYQCYMAHFGMLGNGVNFTLSVISVETHIASQILSGFIMEPNGYVYAVSWSDMALPNFPDGPSNLPVQYEVHFTANGKMYTLKVTRLSCVTLPHGETWPAITFLSPCRFEINGVVGSGNVEYQHPNKGRMQYPKPRPGIRCYDKPKGKGNGLVFNLNRPEIPKFGAIDYPLCIALDEPLCIRSALTGGKASKLAMLAQASRCDADFVVPEGFALTIGAFEKQLKANPEIQRTIDILLGTVGAKTYIGDWQLSTPTENQIQEACNKVVELLKSTELVPEVKSEILAKMAETFGDDDWSSVFVAVRSSACGEDNSEASSAGLMTSHLHIQGENAIVEAVKKCWASNFDYQVVKYRRLLCSRIDPAIAVLIQRLVTPDTAGVMFTRDPNNGSMARIVINASFGLGEDVVSGKVEPDTITVKRFDYVDWNRFEIVHTRIGSKGHNGDIDGGHGEIEHGDCCLSDEIVRRLAKVGVAIEQSFASPRDIEWAIASDKSGGIGDTRIHILQARPITTKDTEDDWELEREFDTPLASKKEWLTTANISEMMPGALTPLSSGLWIDMFSESLVHDKTMFGIAPSRRIFISRMISLFNQHPFINYTMTTGIASSARAKRSIEMSIFGELKPELPPMEEMQDYSDNKSKLWLPIANIMRLYGMVFPERVALKVEKELATVFTPHAIEPDVLLQQIRDLYPLMKRGWLSLVQVSARSIGLQMIILQMISPDASKWTSSHVGKLSILLQSCPEVYTIDVPRKTQEIARVIVKVGKRDEFLALDDNSAAHWLMVPPQNDKEASEPSRLFKEFLRKHGHRCVRETDFREKSWREQPEKLVQAIKALLKQDDVDEVVHKSGDVSQHLSVDEAIDSLGLRLSGIKRKILRFIVTKARESVGRREWAKSLAIKSMEPCREAFRRLANLLTERGYLPDEDLIYYLSMNEIARLTQGRSAKLIFKALRRRKMFCKLNDKKFPELVEGYPVALSEESEKETPVLQDGQNLVVKGIPVGNQSVTGTARVISSFSEAGDISNGEILVVPYTDVGWTPYFPLLSGLVTELGGLLSHGAIIAREYGLPCLVGCKDATKLIKSGAKVRIDASTGKVEILG